MVEMKREDFISQMIAELARQRAADESAFANPPIRNSMEIFRSLCFDFPTVNSDEISALANAVNKIALEKADIDSVGGFSLEEKFLQNLIYLSGSTPDVVDNNRESAVSSLCSAVFINLPLRLLTLSRKQLSTIFRDQPSTAIPIQNDFSASGKEIDLLPWVEICHRVRNFIMLGTSSLLTCSPTSATTVDSRIGDCLVSLSTAIKMVRCDKRNRDIVRVKMDDTLTTLHQCFLFNDDLVLKAALDDRKAGDGPAAAAGAAVDGTAQSTSTSSLESESSAICGMAKDVWIHLSFLCRDLFVQHPESLDHPTALPSVLGALIPLGSITITGTGPSSSFPTAEECVFALILAGIVTGVVHTDAADTARDAGSAGVTATTIDDKHVRLKQRAVRCSKARTTLRKHLDSFSPSLLVVAVVICERISSTSASNTNGDGAALLCDIATLYTAETEGAAQALSPAHPHEHLMSSRALSALVCMWVDIVSREGGTASDKDKTLSAASSADADAEAVTIAPHRTLGPTASRIMQTLAVLCLQRPLTATYVLKIPRLVIGVVKATKQWQSGTGTEDIRYVLPGEAIGLLIALLLVAETQPKSPADSTAESLSESLTSALAQLKAEVYSAFAAVGKRKDGQRQTLPLDVYGTKEELNQKKRYTTFLAPKGLLQSLRLITSESGGASSLRSSVTMKARGGGGAGRISAVRALQEWAADILSPPNAPLVLPEIRQEEIMKEVEEEIVKEEIGKEGKGEEEIVKEKGKELIVKEEEEDERAKQEEDLDEDENENENEKIVKQEEKDEEEDDGGGDVEELRRLVKALQALLQGFSTSKID